MKMPWGKYKGRDIMDLPSSYLHWLAGSDDEEIAAAADEEWRWREDHQAHTEDD